MKCLTGAYDNIMLEAKSVITIGKFDALHAGHRRLISKTVELASQNGLSSVLLSIVRSNPIGYLLSFDEKKEILSDTGLDYSMSYHLDDHFASISAEWFIEEILQRRLKCQSVVAGEDFRFGYERRGSVDTLKAAGISVNVIPTVKFDVLPSSSENIRRLVLGCAFDAAATLLGYRYFVSGTVEQGNKLGRKIGFPTVNVLPQAEKLLPPDGVYLTRTITLNGEFKSITNIGKNPTVNGNSRKVETHLLDFDKELYSQQIKIEFFKKIRDEKKFDSINKLKSQIEEDIRKVSQCVNFI